MMTSMQAISGGGRSPGVSAMQINDNIIPYIAKEEAKVRIETRKILGKINGDVIKDADIKVSSTCTRVPVIDGHTESVFVETSSDIDPEKAKKMYAEENKNSTVASLPSAPEHYYAFHTDPSRPQPRLERTIGDGMTTTINFSKYLACLDAHFGLFFCNVRNDVSFICIAETPGDLPPPDIACIEVIITFLLHIFHRVVSMLLQDLPQRCTHPLPLHLSTKSSAYRYETDVPILIPGINDDHADLLDVQKKNRNWKGWVAPLPNCTTTGLAITLKPLYEKYGAKKVMMTSMQAISGGGRSPGVSAMQINDNIIPYIAKEVPKCASRHARYLEKLMVVVIPSPMVRSKRRKS